MPWSHEPCRRAAEGTGRGRRAPGHLLRSGSRCAVCGLFCRDRVCLLAQCRADKRRKKINQKPNQINVQLINSAAKNAPPRGGNGAGGRLAPSALVKGVISEGSLLGPKKPRLQESADRLLPAPPLRDGMPALAGRAGGWARSRSPPRAVSIAASALLSNTCLDRAGWPQIGLSGLHSGCRCSCAGGRGAERGAIRARKAHATATSFSDSKAQSVIQSKTCFNGRHPCSRVISQKTGSPA